MLSKGNVVPSLHNANLTQVAEAIRIGPTPMPVFGPGQMSDQEMSAIAHYVQYLHHPADPGRSRHRPLRSGGRGFRRGNHRIWLAVVRDAHDRDQRMTTTDRPDLPPGADHRVRPAHR